MPALNESREKNNQPSRAERTLTFKRAYHGTFHQVSAKHFQRYANEGAGRQGLRSMVTIDQMKAVACGMVGLRVTYRALVQANEMTIECGENEENSMNPNYGNATPDRRGSRWHVMRR